MKGKCLHGNCTMRRGSLQFMKYMQQSSQVTPPSWSHECIHPVVQAVPCHMSPQQQEAWHTRAVSVPGCSPLFHLLQEDSVAYQARDPLLSHHWVWPPQPSAVLRQGSSMEGAQGLWALSPPLPHHHFRKCISRYHQ